MARDQDASPSHHTEVGLEGSPGSGCIGPHCQAKGPPYVMHRIHQLIPVHDLRGTDSVHQSAIP